MRPLHNVVRVIGMCEVSQVTHLMDYDGSVTTGSYLHPVSGRIRASICAIDAVDKVHGDSRTASAGIGGKPDKGVAKQP